MARANKALGHVLVDGKWVHKFQRQPDAQSPAGGVSSSVNDMAKWIRLKIANGKFGGEQIIAEKALVQMDIRNAHRIQSADRTTTFMGWG